MKSPIQKVQEKIARMKVRNNNDLSDLDDFLKDLLEDELYEFQQAWVDGNKAGWNQSSDWPEHGEQYYRNRFSEKAES